jgi:acyl-CoA thioesterase I
VRLFRSPPIALALLVAALPLAACGDAPSGAPASGRGAPARAIEGAEDGARDAPGAVQGEGPLVLFLGDSIAAGLDLPADDAFPAVLQRELAREGVPFRLINAGLSGDTTAGGLRRLDWLLKQDPDVVAVELGGNDGLRGLPLEAIEANLDAIVARAQASGARVLQLGTYLPPNYGADYTAGFAALQRRVAEARGTTFVPFFLEGVGGVPELNQADGLHPTAEGQRLVAQGLAPVLRKLLEELR